jgi:hypothetical protein
VLLREVDELDARVLAERMRSDIEMTAIAYGNQTIRITVSIGIASRMPRTATSRTPSKPSCGVKARFGHFRRGPAASPGSAAAA